MVADDNPPLDPDRGAAAATLYRLGYVSTQTRPLSSAEMLSLLHLARENNAAHDVTGLLLHREDSFFQVLEGPEQAVLEIFETLQSDSRHQRIEILFEGACEEREFPDWRMGFSELDGIDVSQLPGFSDFLLNDIEPRRLFDELTRTQRLMMLFKMTAC
jgi:hypothetical protein